MADTATFTWDITAMIMATERMMAGKYSVKEQEHKTGRLK